MKCFNISYHSPNHFLFAGNFFHIAIVLTTAQMSLNTQAASNSTQRVKSMNLSIPQIISANFDQSVLKNRTFKFDFPDFEVGTAEYEDGPTGCTVFKFKPSGLAAVDVRGGAAALREESILEPGSSDSSINALVLTGGSTYGLESASGVMSEILKEKNNSTKFSDIPSVPAAVVYDFSGRNNAIFPDKALGAKAYLNAQENQVQIGQAGAGSFVTVGKYLGRTYSERSGQGAAFFQKDGVRIFVLTVLNAVGNIFNKKGQIIAGSLDPITKTRIDIATQLKKKNWFTFEDEEQPTGNTTISIVITNVRLSRLALKRLAIMSHTAMAAGIAPFHTPYDGDSLFAVSTLTMDKPSTMDETDIGTIAGSLLHDAIMEAVKVD